MSAFKIGSTVRVKNSCPFDNEAGARDGMTGTVVGEYKVCGEGLGWFVKLPGVNTSCTPNEDGNLVFWNDQLELVQQEETKARLKVGDKEAELRAAYVQAVRDHEEAEATLDKLRTDVEQTKDKEAQLDARKRKAHSEFIAHILRKELPQAEQPGRLTLAMMLTACREVAGPGTTEHSQRWTYT